MCWRTLENKRETPTRASEKRGVEPPCRAIRAEIRREEHATGTSNKSHLMNEKELQALVDDAVTLHREIAKKSEQLKALKAGLVQQARLNPDQIEATESGGQRWAAKGSDGCIARVSFPASALISEVEAESDLASQLQAIAGGAFRRLFKAVKVFQPAENFRLEAASRLSAAKTKALMKLCEKDGAPRVSFEAASQPAAAALE